MIGTVISPDLNRMAQLQPNQRARFVAITLEEGLAARRHYNQQLERLNRFFLA
jgi:allophanate hydrolase subunit 2